MKFGELLEENSVPQWREKYIDYNKLKMMIRTIIENNPSVPKVVARYSEWKMSRVQEQFHSPGRWTTQLEKLSFKRIEEQRAKPNCIFEWLEKRSDFSELEKEFFAQIAREHAKVESFFFSKSQHYGKKLNELIPLTRETVKGLEGSLRLKIEYNFKEIWRGLQLLANYRIWNFLGFAKILKKHDKNSAFKIKDELMGLIGSSQFARDTLCDDCMGLLEKKFKEIFVHGSDKRKEIIRVLSPEEAEQCTRQEFLFTGGLLGFGLGCLFFLVFGYLMITEIPGLKSISDMLEPKIPMIRFLLFFCLIGHLIALNLVIWEKFGNNWQFIFCASHEETAHSTQVFMFSSICFGTLMASVSIAITLFKFSPKAASIIIDALPILFATLMFAPIEILLFPLRRLTMKTFGRVFRATIWPPAVDFPDFFIADQFTSWVCLGKDLTCIAYYYMSTTFSAQHCKNIYDSFFGWVLRPLPYWWRFMQCVRRWRTTQDSDHLWNMGKYALSILLQLSSQLHKWNGSAFKTKVVMLAVFTPSFCYSLTWDLYMDWGLFKTSNLLRPRISYPKWWYYTAILFNLLARLAALYGLLLDGGNFKNLMLGGLEIVRRGIWNIFRVENESVSNTGKFRAVNLIPLPQLQKHLLGEYEDVALEDKDDSVDSISSLRKDLL